MRRTKDFLIEIINKLIEPRNDIAPEKKTFTTRAIIVMTIPLLIEQFLQLVVGIADSMVSSYAGQVTIAGVSLVTTIYSVFIFIFSGLSLGGSVIISQSMGEKRFDKASEQAGQTFLISFALSIICMVLMLIFGRNLLDLLYGSADDGVLKQAEVYLGIVSLSFPANAVYNVCAGMQKCLSRTKVTMYISIIINAINIIGDFIGVFVLRRRAAGVAWPTTISWYVAAFLIIIISTSDKYDVKIELRNLFKINTDHIKGVLDVAIPNMTENGLFQVAKVVLASVIATFGIDQIAANGIGQTIWNLTAICGIAAGPVFVTVVGQAKGAGERDVAEYYWIKLTKVITLLSFAWNLLFTLILPLFLDLYRTSPEVAKYVIITTVLHNMFTGTISVLALTSPSGFKAAGDIKFPLYSALLCTCVIRVALTFILGRFLGLGIIGYMCAMCCDWTVKAILVFTRFRSGKWYRQ